MRMSALVFVSGLVLTLSACAASPDINPIYGQTTQYKGTAPQSVSTPSPVQQATYRSDIQNQSATNSNVHPAAHATQSAAPVNYTGQTASYTQINQECLAKEGDRKLVGTLAGGVAGGIAGRAVAGDNKTLGTVAGAAIGGAAGFGIADKSINCDPVSVPAPQTATISPAYQPAPTTTYATTTSLPTTPSYRSQTTTAPAIEETTESLGDAGTPGYYAVNGAPDYTPAPIPPTPVYQAPTYASQSTMITAPGASTRNHTLVDGDTVYSLAKSACVSVSEFKQLNNIDDKYYIRAGDQILIPASRCTP
ncbi:MAG: LysM domain-containing protein [Acidimicrobiales bacterium]|nr:LysM peptidoglycan-binding domain-containing protein [Hyphomonadaceae bacterium]RZV40945.1 MAG: LysM domain-containing protein [Acidimicrobiales bacterium]